MNVHTLSCSVPYGTRPTPYIPAHSLLVILAMLLQLLVATRHHLEACRRSWQLHISHFINLDKPRYPLRMFPIQILRSAVKSAKSQQVFGISSASRGAAGPLSTTLPSRELFLPTDTEGGALPVLFHHLRARWIAPNLPRVCSRKRHNSLLLTGCSPQFYPVLPAEEARPQFSPSNKRRKLAPILSPPTSREGIHIPTSR